MTDTSIDCPSCGFQIPVSQALNAKIRDELEARLKAEHQTRMEQAVAAAERRARGDLDLELKDLKAQIAEKARVAAEAAARELALRAQTRDLEERQARLAEQIRGELETSLRQEQEVRIHQATAEAEARLRAQGQATLAQLQDELAAQRARVQQAEAAELALRKEKCALEERARTLDLEVARRIDAERQHLEQSIRQHLSEEQDLKLKEKEKQIADLRKALDEAKRKSDQGSQERQGEVLELDIQAALERQFPLDLIEPVPKGMRGADIQQRVRNERLEDCGLIVWETKNTKGWQPAWLDKLKQDQRTVGAGVAVLVSVTLPEALQGFGRLDGVWVADLRTWPALALVLREQLIQVAYARAASAGKGEKMERLYAYLSGEEFRQRVEAIVEAFTAMQSQIHKERRALEKHWAEREKQIERVINSTSGMYGALQGIVGGGLAAIPALELDDTPRLGRLD